MSAESRVRLLLSALVALALTALPLPAVGWTWRGRPFPVLTVLYWSVNAPRTGGIGFGFFAGLTLDVFQGPVLGEHALALALIAYIGVREHQRIRSKPAFQQALIVFAALVVYEVVLFAIDGWTGHAADEPAALGTHGDWRSHLAAGAAVLAYGAGRRA